MKKVFVLFLVLLLVAFAAFAVTVSETAGTENPATVNASLDLSGGDGDDGFVRFGFYSGSAPKNFSITTTTYGDSISEDTVKLYPTVDESTGDAKLIATNLPEKGSEFYLFYQIVSGTKYYLKLSLDGKMKLNNVPTLDWTVTLPDAPSINVTTVNGEVNQSKTIFTHDPYQDNATVTSAAAYNVEVTTEDISGLKQGTYEGEITLTLTTEGTGA